MSRSTYPWLLMLRLALGGFLVMFLALTWFFSL